MVSSKKDSDTQLFTKFNNPLVLVPDTAIQRTLLFRLKKYNVPCSVSNETFNNMAAMVMEMAVKAHFDYTGQPLYQVFNNELFRGQRWKFWKPLLRMKFPIYIVSPLFGVIWPGDYGGLYDLPMEETFLEWRKNQLWRVVLELFESNKCDCVLSYLPVLYDNIVRVEATPWFIFKPTELLKHRKILLSIARKRCKSASNTQKR